MIGHFLMIMIVCDVCDYAYVGMENLALIVIIIMGYALSLNFDQ